MPKYRLVPPPPGRKPSRSARRVLYDIDEDFFFRWFAADSYVVGFLAADGHIGQRDFTAANIDIETLQQIRKAMRSEHPIRRHRNYFRLRIGSKRLVRDLKSMGLISPKHKRILIPYLPEPGFWHFLRGYFDGDGMVKIQAGGGLVLKLSSASKQLLVQIRRRVTLSLGVARRPVRLRKQIKNGKRCKWYELIYCGETAAKIGTAMYGNHGGLFMKRKKEIFDAYIDRPKLWGLRNSGNASKYDKHRLSPRERLTCRREFGRLRQARYRARKKALLS